MNPKRVQSRDPSALAAEAECGGELGLVGGAFLKLFVVQQVKAIEKVAQERPQDNQPGVANIQFVGVTEGEID